MTFLDDQAALATRAQLQAAGCTPDLTRAQVDARRWRSINQVVVCTHNGPLTIEQARWAAVLSAPGAVALCAETALDCHGVSGFAGDAVHIVVARGARVLPVPGVEVVVHESRRFSPADVLPWRPPVTSVERAAVDAAVWSRDVRASTRILTATIQQRFTTATRLREVLGAAGAVRHRRILLAFLADLEGGAEALSEVAFMRWCRRHDIPTPRLQVRLDHSGRRRYLDATFDLPGGRRVLVEIDGGIHLTLAARWKDTAKDNDAALAGETTLRFPSVAIYTDDPVAVAQLRQALTTCQRQRVS